MTASDKVGPSRVVLPSELRRLVPNHEYPTLRLDSCEGRNVQEISDWCVAFDRVVVPGPSRPISVADIVQFFPTMCEELSPDLLALQASTESVQMLDWYVLPGNLIAGSRGKTIREQVGLMFEGEFIPTAAEAAWAVAIGMLARGIFPIRANSIRTNTPTRPGWSLGLSSLGNDGIQFGEWADDVPYRHLAILPLAAFGRNAAA